MKLKDLLKEIFKDGPLPDENLGNNYMDYVIKGKMLESIKPELLKCDEFKDVNINIINLPSDTKIYKLRPSKYSGSIDLYSIMLTPEIYDPSDIDKPVKDGISISPTIIDSTTFTPYKKITIQWNTEKIQDINVVGGNDLDDFKKDLYNKLDALFIKPKEYQTKGKRGILFRCIFSEEPKPIIDPCDLYSFEL